MRPNDQSPSSDQPVIEVEQVVRAQAVVRASNGSSILDQDASLEDFLANLPSGEVLDAVAVALRSMGFEVSSPAASGVGFVGPVSLFSRRFGDPDSTESYRVPASLTDSVAAIVQVTEPTYYEEQPCQNN